MYYCDLCPLGLVSRQEGDLQMSLELFQKAVRLNPNHAASVKQVARSQYVTIPAHLLSLALITWHGTSIMSINCPNWLVIGNGNVNVCG